MNLTFHSAIIGYKLIEETIGPKFASKKPVPHSARTADTHKLNVNVERFESISKDYIELLQKMMNELKDRIANLSLPSRIPYQAGNYLVCLPFYL